MSKLLVCSVLSHKGKNRRSQKFPPDDHACVTGRSHPNGTARAGDLDLVIPRHAVGPTKPRERPPVCFALVFQTGLIECQVSAFKLRSSQPMLMLLVLVVGGGLGCGSPSGEGGRLVGNG
jgi:hypothetical protein